MEAAATLISIALLGALWIAHSRAQRRGERLLVELEDALDLATEAQNLHWRTNRCYTGDLTELARLRPALQPFLDGSRHGNDTEWELSSYEDGDVFELVVHAVPAVRVKGQLLYKHLVMVEGEKGDVSRHRLDPDVGEARLPQDTFGGGHGEG